MEAIVESEICPRCAKLNTFEEFEDDITPHMIYVKCSECAYLMFPEDVPKVEQEAP